MVHRRIDGRCGYWRTNVTMKKINTKQSAAKRTAEALNEVETAIFGEPTGRFRTGIRAGAEGDPPKNTCKPWLCPMPMYGIPLPTEL